MNISALFSQMLVLFGILLIGFFTAKRGILNADMNKHLSTLVCMLTNPLQVLASVLSGVHPIENLRVLQMTGVAAAMFAALILISLLLPRALRIKNPLDAGIYRYLLVFSNIGFMGYPVVEALFGAEYRFYATIFVMVFQLVCWSYGVSLISGQRMQLSWSVLRRPTIVTALLAFVLYFADIRPLYDAFPAGMTVVYRIVDGIGGLTSPIAMLIIGASLAQMPLRAVFNRWRIYVLAAVKMIVLPVLTWLALRGVMRDAKLFGVLIVMLSMPSATNATIMSYQFGGDEKLASAGVFVTTLLSVATIPLVMYLLFYVFA